MKFCIDCKKEVKNSKAKRCWKCSHLRQKGKNAPNYKNGRAIKKYHCLDCGKKVCITNGMYGKQLCKSCSMKKLFKNPKNHPKNIDGRTNKQYFCKICNKKISLHSAIYGKKRCHSCANKIRTKETKKKMSLSAGGTGIPYEHNDYPKEFYEIKEQIRKRDNYECQNCGMTEEEHLIVFGMILHVHHIDYNKQNCNENNLVALCLQCNLRANSNRDYWKGIYNNIKENKKC